MRTRGVGSWAVGNGELLCDRVRQGACSPGDQTTCGGMEDKGDGRHEPTRQG